MTNKSHYNLTVIKNNKITPNMLRVVFSGEDLDDFPSNMDSGYLKLVFPVSQSDDKVKQVIRTYTIRHFDEISKEIMIDFALHDDSEGIASSWAKKAKIGDELMVRGPGPKKLVNNQADWFFLIGDMTSLPAISCNLEQLPDDATGYVIIEITSKKDKQKLICPKGVKINWVVNSTPYISSGALVKKVKEIPFQAGIPSIWVACEFTNMRALRHYFKDECGVHKDNIYVSSYWKIACSEDQHRTVKQQDARQQFGWFKRAIIACLNLQLIRKLRYG